jgi:hypothetical protein
MKMAGNIKVSDFKVGPTIRDLLQGRVASVHAHVFNIVSELAVLEISRTVAQIRLIHRPWSNWMTRGHTGYSLMFASVAFPRVHHITLQARAKLWRIDSASRPSPIHVTLPAESKIGIAESRDHGRIWFVDAWMPDQ